MTPHDRPRGTEGLGPRAPIAVAIATGRKSGGGFPVDTHRFFVVNAHADGKGAGAVRAMHPSFARFNAMSTKDVDQAVHDAKRAVIRGNLVHATEDECFFTSFKGQSIPGHMHPQMKPSCQGNGHRAIRWFPERRDDRGNPLAAEFREIPCPGLLCEYQQPGEKNGKPTRPLCTPYACVVFQLRWEADAGMPCLSAKYETRGKEANALLQGFFADIQRQADALGVHNPSLYGIPFVLDLSRRSDAGRGTKWFVPSMSLDFPPGMTLQQFLVLQVEQRGHLVSHQPLLLGTAATVIDAMDEDDGRAGNMGAP